MYKALKNVLIFFALAWSVIGLAVLIGSAFLIYR